MRNASENGGVGMWLGTVVWNMVDNFDVECSRERRCGMWRGTVVWNMVDNFDVECSGEWLREIWRRTVMLGRNA